jgi:hypothetical protein
MHNETLISELIWHQALVLLLVVLKVHAIIPPNKWNITNGSQQQHLRNTTSHPNFAGDNWDQSKKKKKKKEEEVLLSNSGYMNDIFCSCWTLNFLELPGTRGLY